jgi:hypothetical protein
LAGVGFGLSQILNTNVSVFATLLVGAVGIVVTIRTDIFPYFKCGFVEGWYGIRNQFNSNAWYGSWRQSNRNASRTIVQSETQRRTYNADNERRSLAEEEIELRRTYNADNERRSLAEEEIELL